MTRERARSYTEDEKRALYALDWSQFAHQERIDETIALGTTLPKDEVRTIADMSAGGTYITPVLAEHYGCNPVLGDYSAQYGYSIVGTYEETIPRIDPVDLFVSSETLEHVEDPDGALRMMRSKCRYLLLTTPIMEKNPTVSHGHLWVWDREDIEAMLGEAGFENVVEFREFSIWGLWVAK